MASHSDLTTQFPALTDAINARVAAGDGLDEGNQAFDLLQRELALAGINLNAETQVLENPFHTSTSEAPRRRIPTATTEPTTVASPLEDVRWRQLLQADIDTGAASTEARHFQARHSEIVSNQDISDEHLAKRRRLEAETKMKDTPEVVRHGQVFAQQLPLALINHDGLNSRGRLGSPNDILNEHAGIYTTDTNPCNFLLKQEHDDTFACAQIGVKLSLRLSQISASRRQRFKDMYKVEGLVWISLEEEPLSALISHKMAYINYGSEYLQDHERRICFYPPGVDGNNPAYSIEATGHPSFQVKTHYGNKKPPQSLAEYFSPFESEHEHEKETDEDDSSSIESDSDNDDDDDDDNNDDEDDEVEDDLDVDSDDLSSDNTSTPVPVSGPNDSTTPGFRPARASEARPLMTHSNASSTNINSRRRTIPAYKPRDDVPQPYARFTLNVDKPEVQINLEPEVAAKRILIKLWNPYETDSIYVDSITAYGFDGPRCFPSMKVR